MIIRALVLSIVFSRVPLGLIGTLIAMIPLVLAVVRMLSRNRTQRAQANLAFLKLWNPVRNWFQWLYLSIRYCKKNKAWGFAGIWGDFGRVATEKSTLPVATRVEECKNANAYSFK